MSNEDSTLTLHISLKVELKGKTKSFITAEKGILKLVGLQSLVAKYSKIRKIDYQILYLFVLHAKKVAIF